MYEHIQHVHMYERPMLIPPIPILLRLIMLHQLKHVNECVMIIVIFFVDHMHSIQVMDNVSYPVMIRLVPVQFICKNVQA